MTILSPAAVVRRINVELAKRHQKLKKSRGVWARAEVGDWYVIDTSGGVLLWKHVDPEAFARKIGVLGDGEEVG